LDVMRVKGIIIEMKESKNGIEKENGRVLVVK
jgi:hypothetical protein